MKGKAMKRVLGIVGGMGPLASAEFLKTIYECSTGEREQEFPVVLVYSDPTFPDRTEAFLAGRTAEALERLDAATRCLIEMGASQIVLCCMTVHYLLPSLPPETRRRVISLFDVIYERFAHTEGRHLLVCSIGARQLRLFEQHERWERFKDRIVLPDEPEQRQIHHDLIYPIKKNTDTRELMPILESLLAKHRVNSFIVGCTEVHLIAKQFVHTRKHPGDYGCVDPLMILARDLAKEY